MYILLYFAALGVVTSIINKTNSVDSSEEFLKWERIDLIIIGSGFLSSVILEIINSLIKLPFFVAPLYLLVCIILVFYVNKNREKHIQEYKKQIEQIFDSINKLLNIKEIEYNNLPFEIEKDGDKINKITVVVGDSSKFNDGSMTSATFSLKRYFPYYDWKYKLDLPKKEAIFEGQKLPPDVAMWPGSDLRGSAFIPIGLAGNGEVGFNFGEKNMGDSLYVYEDGSKAGTCSLPSAPQCLIVGATGGGKAIWVEQEIW